MKRRREVERKSEIKSAIEELSMFVKVKPVGAHNYDTAHLPTKPFVSICNLVIQVLDKIGPMMGVFRGDIHQNIQRIEMMCEADPLIGSNLIDMLRKEVKQGIAKKGNSCSKAFVWLIRAMDFTVALLQRLSKDFEQVLEVVVEESYNVSLKPWHGWISTAAFKVALKLVPDTKIFIDLLKSNDESYESLKDDINKFITLLSPTLEHIHSVLIFYDLDRLKST